MNEGRTRSFPWHREPLVWMVLAIPAAAVVAGAVMLVLANATWDGLVADDYYRRGMQINRSLARDEEAARLGLAATVAFPAPGRVEVHLSRPMEARDGDPPHLRFARAGRAGRDVEVDLRRSAHDAWRGEVPALPSGKWYAEIGTARWRLAAPVWMPAGPDGFTLRPAGTSRGRGP